VWFRPVSDGILDYRYTDFDDWVTMGHFLCQRLVDTRESAGGPTITC
jgi:hypothetical protein